MSNFNILVVDDEVEICNAIEIYLKREGLNVLKAYDGIEALQILEEEKIHLIKDLIIDTTLKSVTLRDEPVKLTATEYGILLLLASNNGKVFSIKEIYENVWKAPFYHSENTVTVHIRRMREKIEINSKDPEYIKVVWGVGYKIENPS